MNRRLSLGLLPLVAIALVAAAPAGRAGLLHGVPGVPATTPDFQDVPTDSSFYPYLHNLYTQGIVGGYPCGGAGEPCVAPDNLPYYRPANSVTRNQMTKFVDLARHQPGIDIRTTGSLRPIYISSTNATSIYAESDGIFDALYGTNTGSGTAVTGVSVGGTAVSATSINGTAVSATSTNGTGVYGITSGTNAIGVWGVSNNGATAKGVYGSTTGGYGVLGEATTAQGYGIEGRVSGSASVAGHFMGNVNIIGTLSKTAGSFKIDDPIDPEHKYLYHSFVESPDMMNIYNGNVTTDANGDATITLPAWFEKLNQDFRYQLTPIGQFAQAIVAREIEGNQFAIKTDKPNVKVSWQVTGIRHDPYAEQNRIPVEQVKPAGEQGTYLYPKGYGQPDTAGVDYAREHNTTP